MKVGLCAHYGATKESLGIADSRSLGLGSSIVSEQGARVAHNSPNKQGGPVSGLSHLLRALRTDLGQGCSSTYLEFYANVSLPGTGFWRMIDEARS